MLLQYSNDEQKAVGAIGNNGSWKDSMGALARQAPVSDDDNQVGYHLALLKANKVAHILPMALPARMLSATLRTWVVIDVKEVHTHKKEADCASGMKVSLVKHTKESYHICTPTSVVSTAVVRLGEGRSPL